MRVLLAGAAVAMLATAAVGQEPTITDACAKALAFYWNVPEVTVIQGTIQAFPDLDPPRVRFEVEGLGKTTAESLMPGKSVAARCEFASTTKPFGLREFECGGCFATPARVEELGVLLGREGF